MRAAYAIAAIVCLVSCGTKIVTSSEPAPAPANASPASNVLYTFEGSADPRTGVLEVVYRDLAGGVIHPQSVLPTGSGPDTITLHTLANTTFWEGTCGTTNLCGQVEAINNYTGTVTGLSAMIDWVSDTTVTNDGPWTYGDVDAGATSMIKTWTFSDPNVVQFKFSGHVDGTAPGTDAGSGSDGSVAGDAGPPVLTASPSASTLAVAGPAGAAAPPVPAEAPALFGSGLPGGVGSYAALWTVSNTGGSPTGSLTTSAPSPYSSSSLGWFLHDSCKGQKLNPGDSCTMDLVLDCRAEDGVSGSQSAVITVTDPTSGSTVTKTVTGTCASYSGSPSLSVTGTAGGTASMYGANTVKAFTSALSNSGTAFTHALTFSWTNSGVFTSGSLVSSPPPAGAVPVSNGVNSRYSIPPSSFDCSPWTSASSCDNMQVEWLLTCGFPNPSGAQSSTVTVSDSTGKLFTFTLTGNCQCIPTNGGCQWNGDCCNGTCKSNNTCN
jgi:hypothetical protein